MLAFTVSICKGQKAGADYVVPDAGEIINNPAQRLEYLLKSATEYTRKADKKAIDQANEALNIAKSLQDKKSEAEALNLLGVAWKISGDNARSGEYLFDALSIFEELKLSAKYAEVLRNIGETFRAAASLQKSQQYLLGALSLEEHLQDTIALAATYNRLAATSFELFYGSQEYKACMTDIKTGTINFDQAFTKYPEFEKKYNLVKYFIIKSLQYSQLKKLTDIRISTLIIDAALSYSLSEYTSALRSNDKVIQLIDSSGFDTELPLVLYNKAKCFFEQGNTKQALENALKSYSIATKKDIKIYIILNAGIIYDIYLLNGQLEEAIRFLRTQYQTREDYYHSEIELKINTMQYRYEIDQKENQINFKNAHTRNLIWSFSILLLIVGIFSIVLIFKNKKALILNAELTEKNQIILNQNEQLAKINANKDKLFSIVAHDLRSPMSGFLGLSNVIIEESNQLSVDEIKSIASSMRISAITVQRLLENLFEWSKLEQGNLKINPVSIRLSEVIINTIDLMAPFASNKEIKLLHEIPEHIKVSADLHSLETILRNLLSNAIKFSEKGDTVLISAQKQLHNVIISINDTGIGMSEEQLESLFNISVQANRKGTSGEPSTGLGLVLSKEFTELNQGSIRVESTENSGTTFFVTLPSG
jgi:signal transduction histidine kinase